MNKMEKFVGVKHWIVCAVAAVVGGETLSAAQAATIPFVNEFDSTGFSNATAQFTLDSGNGVLNYVAGGGVVLSTASESVTMPSTPDFVVSTGFTLNNAVGSGNLPTMGFGILGSSASFLSTGGDSFYLADWGVSSTLGAAGQLRILAQGNTAGFAGVNGDSDGANANGSSVVVGNTYELRLTATYLLGTLNMTFAMYDGSGNQLGTAATATDTSPLAGQFFGYRNRTAGVNHNVSVSYDYFSVIPEPASLLLSMVGALALAAANWRKPGRS